MKFRISIYLMVAPSQLIAFRSVSSVAEIDTALRFVLAGEGGPENIELVAGDSNGFYWAEFTTAKGVTKRVEVYLESLWK